MPLVDLEPYPEALVDRPLTLLPGMTQVSIEYELASTTTETFHNRTPDIAARHAFGPVEVRADLGELATLSALIATDAFPAAILVGAASGAPQSDDSLHEGQFVALEHKVQLAPAQCAAFFAVGASYNENRIAESASMLVWTHVLVADADAELEVQLLPTVALDVGLSVQLPVAMSDEIHATSTVTAASTLMVTVAHSWDLYANGALLDLANYRLPYLAFGFVKRWGG